MSHQQFRGMRPPSGPDIIRGLQKAHESHGHIYYKQRHTHISVRYIDNCNSTELKKCIRNETINVNILFHKERCVSTRQ